MKKKLCESEIAKKETLSKLDQKREKRKQSNGIAATVYLCLSFKYISGLLKVLEKKESKKIMGLQQRYIFACLAAAGGFFNLSGRYYSSSRSLLSKGETHRNDQNLKLQKIGINAKNLKKWPDL